MGRPRRGKFQEVRAGLGSQEMYRVKICSISKTKEPWLKYGIEEYTRRLSPILSIDWALFKTDLQLERALLGERYIALTPTGKAHTSESFSTFLIKTLEAEKSRLTFAIGGATGLSSEVEQKALATLSLSKLTFTHQMTRLILLEQIYRAFEIERGSEYHK